MHNAHKVCFKLKARKKSANSTDKVRTADEAEAFGVREHAEVGVIEA